MSGQRHEGEGADHEGEAGGGLRRGVEEAWGVAHQVHRRHDEQRPHAELEGADHGAGERSGSMLRSTRAAETRSAAALIHPLESRNAGVTKIAAAPTATRTPAKTAYERIP